MGHKVVKCDLCGSWVMEGRDEWRCDTCGAECNKGTGWKFIGKSASDD